MSTGEPHRAEPAVLYQYWRSSASWRVRWALAVKRVPFTSVPIDIVHGAQGTDEHLARNPIGHVPALRIDGHTLAESVAILEYLEETRPEPALYPREPLRRARARQLVELVNAGVQPLQNLVVLRRLSPEAPVQRAWAGHFNERAMHALEALLAVVAREGGYEGAEPGFALGAAQGLSVVELFLVPQCYSARRFGVDLEPFARVRAAERAALATEFAAGALPEAQPGAPASPPA